ncbi:MAG: CHAD domain-containing protein [Cyanobium sp.]|nr:CHAD domain-containing protein [Cyanobium sp.]
MPPNPPASAPGAISNGAHAHSLLYKQCRHIVDLQAAVLEDRDPEPLHQMRVAMRRLRSGIGQFAPCLVLPRPVSERRLTQSVRQLGRARDLDVLRQRLEQDLLPRLAEREQRQLKPVRRQLARERRRAHGHLAEVLQSRRHRKLVAALQGWLRDPAFTPLGEQPLRHWWAEWHLPGSSALMLHPGWWIDNPHQEVRSLHDLRKRIKTVRYQLENLADAAPAQCRDWIDALKEAQGLLGDLNDLAVLEHAIDDQLGRGLHRHMPALAALLQAERLDGWERWRLRAGELIRLEARRRRRRLEPATPAS